MNVFCIRPRGLNIGNDVIFVAMKYFLEKALGYTPNIITLPATSRYETTRRVGLTAATIYEINQYGDGVILGGGNLYENNELDLDPNALKALQVPLFLFSLSRGHIYNRNYELVDRTDVMPDQKIIELNKAACLSSARDKATKKYLEHIGCENVQLSACPTIFLDRIQASLPEISDKQRGLTLISVRNPSLMSIPLDKQAQVHNDIWEIINFLKSEGHNPVLLCHDQRDIPFAASFIGIDYIYFDDTTKYLAVLKSCQLDVSYRLHSTLPCLAYGTPVIKISYDERGLSLMATIGYNEWNINMIEVNSVKDEVADRYFRLSSLPEVKKANAGILNGYFNVTSQLFESFIAQIEARRGR